MTCRHMWGSVGQGEDREVPELGHAPPVIGPCFIACRVVAGLSGRAFAQRSNLPGAGRFAGGSARRPPAAGTPALFVRNGT
jgi:hypothetical protein